MEIGTIVKIKPEWQDEGDSDYIWKTVDLPSKGRVMITPSNIDLDIHPTHVVLLEWLED